MTELIDLTADTAPSGDDLVYVVSDPGGTPADRKVTLDDLAASDAFADLYTPAAATVAAGDLLATVVYDPDPVATPGSTSTTHADIDATNLTVTFTVPASGVVIVELESLVSVTSGTSLAWSLRTTGGTNVTRSEMRVLLCPTVSAASLQARCCYSKQVTGLTPAASTTYRWGHARDSGSGTAQTVYGSTGAAGAYGPAVMRVFAA